MSRPAHPDTSRKGILAAAVVVLIILCFLPSRILGWLDAPRRLLSMVLVPVSAPVHDIAVWLAPAAPRENDPRIAHLESERDRFRTLFLQAQLTIDQMQRRIDELQKFESVSEVAVRQLTASVVGNSSAPSGGVIQIRAGTNAGVERNTIASTAGVQLVGKVTDAGSRLCGVTLITDKASGSIDGVVLADDGARGAEIRNMSPLKGQRILQGQVKYPGPVPKEGDIVRLEDQSWPKSAQRLIVGTITRIKQLPGGRSIVEVKPTVELERLGEVVLLIVPQAESGGKP